MTVSSITLLLSDIWASQVPDTHKWRLCNAAIGRHQDAVKKPSRSTPMHGAACAELEAVLHCCRKALGYDCKPSLAH
eukprot:1277938-Prorocentrum_lima.AAC.1